MYRVTEYIGDYPLEGQEHWGATYLDFSSALEDAAYVWETAVKASKIETDIYGQFPIWPGKNSAYGMGSLSPDYYVLIEAYVDADDDIGVPRMALTSEGPLGNSGSANVTVNGLLAKFLAKYEGD